MNMDLTHNLAAVRNANRWKLWTDLGRNDAVDGYWGWTTEQS